MVNVVDRIFNKIKTGRFFPGQSSMGRVGVGLGLRLRLGSKVAFWAVFEIIRIVILEAHGGHNNSPISILFPK